MKSRTLTHDEIKIFENYAALHGVAFSNPAVQSFFNHNPHVLTLVHALKGSIACWSRIQNAFRRHLFHLRFVRFIASVIQLSTLSFIRKVHNNSRRNPLIIDQPESEDQGKSQHPVLDSTPSVDYYFKGNASFPETIENEKLYGSFRRLTLKQQQVVTLAYVHCYRDSEIAQSMRVSPQAICKTRQKALAKLRSSCSARGVKISG